MLTLREVQEVETGILEAFHNYCEEHGLRYCMTYGTLIGAVRHHGFIPWDNDIDLYMPRPDYDRLITPLDGVMTLTHNGGEPIELNPGDVDGFDGAWHTHSVGRCTDFNLMLRKEQCDGQITVLMPNAIDPAPQHFVPDPQSGMLMLYCAAGSAAIRFPESIEQLIGKEALLLEGEEITSVDLAISAGGCVVAAEVWSI